MKLDELTLGDIKQLQCMMGNKIENSCCINGGIRIVILQRGWVAIGRYSQNGSNCKLNNAYIIRRWGTTEGLGQLAVKGPLADTKLEPTPEISFHELTVIATIQCEEKAWKEKCPV